MERLQSYANAIVNDLLCLRTGDALSINTDERDVEFAKTVARTALEVTDVTVKIVVIEKGKPTQVLEFDPKPPAHVPAGYAMLRLAHKEMRREEGDYLEMVIDRNDLSAVQKLGHLAEPVVLGRKIAVPWCVAEIYDSDDIVSWQAINNTIDCGVAGMALVSSYREQKLADSRIEQLVFKGEGTDFSVDIPEETVFTGGRHVLNSGREFLSGMDFDRLSVIADRTSADGYFTATVDVLGKRQQIRFEFKDGYLVSWTDSPELDRLLGFDENLKRAGYVSLRDNEIIINLGGALSDALRILPDDEEGLPDFFNTSVYTLRCVLPAKTDVYGTGADGVSVTLMKEGFFDI